MLFKIEYLNSYSFSISIREYVSLLLCIDKLMFLIIFVTFFIFNSNMLFKIFWISVNSLSFISSFHVFIENPLLGSFIKFSGILSIIITLLKSLPSPFKSLIKHVTTWHFYSCGKTYVACRACTLSFHSKGQWGLVFYQHT